jgi:hypothetical protein
VQHVFVSCVCNFLEILSGHNFFTILFCPHLITKGNGLFLYHFEPFFEVIFGTFNTSPIFLVSLVSSRSILFVVGAVAIQRLMGSSPEYGSLPLSQIAPIQMAQWTFGESVSCTCNWMESGELAGDYLRKLFLADQSSA